MKKIIIFISLLITTSIFSSNLSLDDAVNKALEYNPTQKSLHYAIQATKSNAEAQIVGYLPKISVNSTINKIKAQNSLSSNTSLNADQLLLSFSGPLQKHQQAKNMIALSELDKEAQANLIRLETAKTFLNAWLIQEHQSSISSLKISAEKIFQLHRNKKKLQQLDKSTWLKNVEEYHDKLAIINAYDDNLQLAYKKLELLIGKPLSPSTHHLSWDYKKTPTLKPLEYYLQQAVKLRPEIARGSKKIAIEEWNVKISQGQQLPVITANGRTGCVVTPGNAGEAFIPTQIPDIVPQPNSQGSTQQGFWSVGLTIQWSLFDGLVSQYQIQEAQANKLKEMLSCDQEFLDVKQQVHDAYFQLSKALKTLNAHKYKYLRANNDFKLMNEKLNLGKISLVEFDTAQTTWQEAHLAWLTQNVKVALSEHQLLHSCGYPLKQF